MLLRLSSLKPNYAGVGAGSDGCSVGWGGVDIRDAGQVWGGCGGNRAGWAWGKNRRWPGAKPLNQELPHSRAEALPPEPNPIAFNKRCFKNNLVFLL